MSASIIVLAGATGNLGERIARALLKRQATVRALLRPGAGPEKIAHLQSLGLTVVTVDFNSPEELAKVCAGADCVVSALSGLRGVIVDAQTQLLNAAVKAGVPRFIPSDYSIDFTRIPAGKNRNLDLRREFQKKLDEAPIAASSILNGAFTDMLTGQAPIVLFKFKWILYWGSADQKMDFTSIDNTAEFTAAVALDKTAPRVLRIAGDQLSVRDLAHIMTEISGVKYRLVRAGGLGVLAMMIKFTRALMPITDELYPPWQGMQYLHNMYSGIASFETIDNDRYFKIRWTTAKDVLTKRKAC